jgi:uncharacterized protein (DUF1015 family)
MWPARTQLGGKLLVEARPFRGLRYCPGVAPNIADLLAPPYDVISPEAQRFLLQRHPANIVRLELSQGRPDDTSQDDRYTRAAATLNRWLAEGILAVDPEPFFYVYDQEFFRGGRLLRRRSLMARVRLEPWVKGVMRPHEHTMTAPKEDRLQLLRHCRASFSPIFGLYRDPDAHLEGVISRVDSSAPLAQAREPGGERHTLYSLGDDASVATIRHLLSDRTLYVADGHHRYETALAYREERCTADWTGDEPENFAFMALTAAEDAGLVVLPIHRVVRLGAIPEDLPARFEGPFMVEDLGPVHGGRPLRDALTRLSEAGSGGPAYVAVGPGPSRLRLLRPRDPEALAASLPPGTPPAWRSLDVAILQHAVLDGLLGIGAARLDRGDALEYTEDGAEALEAVASGRAPLAFLVNATPVEQILAVADTGERMPQKSTFFYPKLATGLVMYPLA